MAKISVFTMGHTGVVIDPNPLEPGVPADALAIAKNAVQDPRSGRGGAVRKRPGLAKFNSAYAGGAILGGIPMPVAGFGGAPAAGGGAVVGTGDSDDGTSVGTGDMTGAAGATFDGGAIATTPPGAGVFTGVAAGDPPIFSGSRLVIVAKYDNTGGSTGGVGWYVAPKSLTSNAVAAATPAQASVYAYPPPSSGSPFVHTYGKAGCVDNIGTTGLYYAGNIGNQATGLTAPTIYRTDGGTNAIIATIPRTTKGEASAQSVPGSIGVLSLTVLTGAFVTGDTVEVQGGTFSAGPATATLISGGGSKIINPGVYSVRPSEPVTITSGVVSGTATITFGTQGGSSSAPIGSVTPVRNAIVDMHYASDGFIYVCVKDKYTGQNTAGSVGRVFRVAPLTGEVVEWNLGSTPGTPELFTHVPYASYYFDGRLYVGTFPDAIDEAAQVYASTGTNAVSEGSFTVGGHNVGFISCFQTYNGRLFMGLGDWDTTPTHAQLWSRQPGTAAVVWGAVLTASGGVATSGNYFVSMVEFGDSLYASWYGNNGSATIYKVTANAPGDPLSTSFTTSSVLTTPGVNRDNPWRLWVDDGVMYAIAEGDVAGVDAWTTTDGTTWTDRTGRLPNFGAAAVARNIFFGLDQ